MPRGPRLASLRRSFRESAAKRRALRLKTGEGPVVRVWEATKRPFIDGRVFEALSYVAASGATWAGAGAPGVRSPEWRAFWQKSAIPLAGAALGAREISKRQKARLNLQGQLFLQRVLTDPEFARLAEHDLVRRFSQKPISTMKLYKTDAMGLASVYSVLHKRRKSPDGRYNMSRHEESLKFRTVMEPLLKNFSLRSKDFRDTKVYRIIDRHGFRLEKGELKRVREMQQRDPVQAAKLIAIPRELSNLLPDSIERASPSTLRQLEDIVLFGSAVIRARQEGVK